MRIFLIGFMGSGKSYTGKQLANALNYNCIDLDEYLIQKNGQTIPEIFQTNGESHFRYLERKALHDMAKYERTIIATGGGTPCFYDNMDWMNRQGVTLYLDVHPQVIIKRLTNETLQRPLLAGKSIEQVQQFIIHKIHERSPYYEQAQFKYTLHREKTNLTEDLKSLIKDLSF